MEKTKIDKDLLEILVCPETRQPVKEAEADRITELNARIEKGEVVNKAGEKVTANLDGGLVREDGTVLYPIREGIPIMLVEEGIPL